MRQPSLSKFSGPQSNRGSLVTTLLAAIIGFIALSAMLYTFSTVRKSQIKRRELLVAESLGAELLEFLVSQSSDRLQNLLSTHPNLRNLTLCSFANQLNRSTNTVSIPVSFADLPLGNHLQHPQFAPSRYFRIDVIDVRTRGVRNDVCGVFPRQVQLPGRALAGTTVNLNPGETFQITVFVEWRSKGTGDPFQISLTSSSQNL